MPVVDYAALARADQVFAKWSERLDVLLGNIAELARREGDTESWLCLPDYVHFIDPSAQEDLLTVALWRLHQQRNGT